MQFSIPFIEIKTTEQIIQKKIFFYCTSQFTIHCKYTTIFTKYSKSHNKYISFNWGIPNIYWTVEIKSNCFFVDGKIVVQKHTFWTIDCFVIIVLIWIDSVYMVGFPHTNIYIKAKSTHTLNTIVYIRRIWPSSL